MPIPDNTRNARWAELDTLAERGAVTVKTDAGEAPLVEFGRAFGVDAFEVTGTTATVQASWHGRMVRFTQGCTVTIPAGLPDNFSCGWSQDGAAAVTFVAGSGVTIESLSDLLDTGGQYAVGGIAAFDADVFRLFGPLA